MFKEIDRHESMRCARRTGIAEGVTFLAARACSSPRTPCEIASLFNVDESVVLKGARRVSDVLGFESTIETSTMFVRRYARQVQGGQMQHLPGRAIPGRVWDDALSLSSLGCPDGSKPHIHAAACVALCFKRHGVPGGARLASILCDASLSSVRRSVALITESSSNRSP